MSGLNRVMLIGYLGADPELKVTQSGKAILRLRLATTSTWLDANNTRQERTEWHSVVMWGKRGESLSRILAKGERIYVEGELRTDSYEKGGEKRYRTEVSATDVILLGSGQPREGREAEERSRENARRPRRNSEPQRGGFKAPEPDGYDQEDLGPIE